jgi:hypothetical protein
MFRITFDVNKTSYQPKSMEPQKKKPYLLRNIEWIALIVLVLAGLIIVWRFFYPGLFSN